MIAARAHPRREDPQIPHGCAVPPAGGLMLGLVLDEACSLTLLRLVKL